MLPSAVARRIAVRYLFSKKSHSVINLIASITIVAIAVPTAAMIILLSVHNGFEDFISRMWKSFDTPYVIEPVEGKYFDPSSVSLSNVNGIDGISYYIDDNVLLRYKERQTVASVRGIDSIYRTMTEIDKIVIQGSADISEGALVGVGIAYQLGLKVNLSEPFTMIAPSVESHNFFNPTSFYKEEKVPLEGIFSLDAQRDSEMIFVSLETAQKLFGHGSSITAIAVNTQKNIEKELQAAVGDKFKVKDIYQQNELEYKLVRSEKVAIYLIILLVMIVASLTLIGTILMLIIEKKENSISLRMLGVTSDDIRKIFIYLGLFISFIGTIGGLIIGLGVSLSQQIWGFVPINGASLLIDSYPIKVIFSDTIIVGITILLITFVISWSSCRLSVKD